MIELKAILTQSEDRLMASEARLMESEDRMMASEARLTESDDHLMESDDRLMDYDDRLTASEALYYGENDILKVFANYRRNSIKLKTRSALFLSFSF